MVSCLLYIIYNNNIYNNYIDFSSLHYNLSLIIEYCVYSQVLSICAVLCMHPGTEYLYSTVYIHSVYAIFQSFGDSMKFTSSNRIK